MWIGFFLGPRYLLFGQFTWITPDYFAETARRDVEPIVRAIKEYEADYGVRPSSARPLEESLVPEYLQLPAVGGFGTELRENGIVAAWSEWNHLVVYDLRAESEGWSVAGQFTHGPIHLPRVTLDTKRVRHIHPSTQPVRGDR